jgi:hypothetical protein
MAVVVRDLQDKTKRLRAEFEHWVAKQPPYMEVAVATVLGGGQGALLGAAMGYVAKANPEAGKAFTPPPSGNPEMQQQMQSMQNMQTAGPLIQARNFAIITGVNAGLSIAVKKWRHGKEDVRNTMIAGFGTGAVFSLVAGMTPGNPAMAAFSTGVLFALAQGGIYKVGQAFEKPKVPQHFERARYLLQTLGLQNYERNLKKALLTDPTIMLWNDSALRDARIPPGPRLLILHHLEQFRAQRGRNTQAQPPLPPVQTSSDVQLQHK